MSLLHWLAAWANVPFTIAALATLLFGFIQASGVMGLLGGGEDAESDADVDADADVDGEAEVDGDADMDGDADAPSFADAMLAPLAIGRVPLSFTAQTFSISFAASGLVINAFFLGGPVPLLTLAWTLPSALFFGYFAASVAARLALPVLDDRAQAATNRHQLVGSIGVVISTTVNEEFGEVRVRDRSGHDLRLIVKLAPHSRVLREREEAVIVDLHEGGTLYVAPLHALPADASAR